MALNNVYYWPQWLVDSWPAEERKKIKLPWLKRLGQGQIYLWQALNIYDDFLDGGGRPITLPQANSAYRNFLKIYYCAGLSANFYKLFNRLLAKLDQANRAEARAKKITLPNGLIPRPQRLPIFSDLTRLADKSLALAVGPLAVLDSLGNQKMSRFQDTLKFFRFSLAAKQLADDARDWLEDLSQEKITAVNVLVLKAAQRRHLPLDLKNDLTTALVIFAKEVSLKTSQEILALCGLARQNGQKINLPRNNQLLTELIKPLEEATQKALKFRHLLFKKA